MAPDQHNVRLGATLITFYNTAYWGLGSHLSYGEWVEAVYADPRRYFDVMLDGMQAAGVEGIELAPVPGGWEGALRAYGSADGVAGALRGRGLVLGSSYQNGVALVGDSLGNSAAASDADAYTRRHAEFVSALGADIIVMGTVPRAPFTSGSFSSDVPAAVFDEVAAQVQRLADVSIASGVRIALHTDAYSVCSRNQDIAEVLSRTDPTSVQLCLDAGHTTLDGGDAVAALAAHIDRIPVMHWKDCIQPLDGSTLVGDQMERHDVMLKYFRIFGQGTIDWKAWQRVLADAQWSGWAMAENDMAPEPIEEIQEAIDFFRKELKPIYA